jgi:hypothetical protein
MLADGFIPLYGHYLVDHIQRSESYGEASKWWGTTGTDERS